MLLLLRNIFRGCVNSIRAKIDPSFRERTRAAFDLRLATCESCDAFEPRFRRCAECGCYVDIKTKILYSTDKEGLAVVRTDRRSGDTYYACPRLKW